MILAVDFDGTMVDHIFPGIGKSNPQAINWLKTYQRNKIQQTSPCLHNYVLHPPPLKIYRETLISFLYHQHQENLYEKKFIIDQ